jgi:hypothetical protein
MNNRRKESEKRKKRKEQEKVEESVKGNAMSGLGRMFTVISGRLYKLSQIRTKGVLSFSLIFFQ